MLKHSFVPGDIVLMEVPYTDLSESKKRPACVLAVKNRDFLVAFITSRLEQADKTDVILPKTPTNGLAADSAVLVQKLFTLHQSLIIRKLGSCTPIERQTILKAVIKILEAGL